MEPKKLEFYQKIIEDRQTQTEARNLKATFKHSYVKEEDERSMTDSERQAWLQEMNRRGF